MKIFLFALILFPLISFGLASVDINTAPIDQIKNLPGIGQKTAEAIVAARPFKTVDDLKNVKGIGEAKFGKLKELVSVGSNAIVAPSAIANPIAVEPAKTPAVTVPSTATAPTPTAASPVSSATHPTKAKLAPGQTINVNTATEEELAKLPGIGPVKAKAIVSGRPYANVDDLTKVKGIKQGTLTKIKPFVTTN